jgi:hypothetical protein
MKNGKVWILLAMFVATLILESCSVNEPCAAYGESRKFQKSQTR